MTADLKARIKVILDQVQARRLSKEEALARIKSLHATPGSEDERAAVHYFREVWQESPIRGATSNGKAKVGGAVLVLASSPEIAEALRAGAVAGPVIWARPAAKFERIGAQDYSFRVGQKEDVERLFQSLAEAGLLPARIVQVGSRSAPGPAGAGLDERLEADAELALLVFQAAIRFKGKEPIHQVYLHLGAADTPSPAAGAVVGLFKELSVERPNFTGRVCHCESMDAKGIARALVETIWPDSDGSAELAIGGADRRVWCKVAERIGLSAPERPVLREHGVCLITGGAGGLGYLFAEHLARWSRARLVLLGRSVVSETIQARLRTLERLGAEARYIQADVGQLAEVEAAVSEVRAVFGPIHAVIHAAGVMPYGRSTDIGLEAIRAVWRAKIQGTLNLDAATRGEPLDWMALFSSIASVIGVAEACGYASGNGFLDHFAEWRAAEVRAGRRVGRTIAFNWPLWEEGGMQVQGQAAGVWRDWMWSSQGMQPLTTSAGVAAFEAGILSEETRIIVAQGDADRIARTLRRGLGWRPETRAAETKVAVKRATVAATRNGDGRESLLTILKGMVGELLSVPEDAIDVKAGLGEFGFDSISLKSFAERLNERFKLDLMPSVFFNHASLGALADHLRAAYPEATQLPGDGDQGTGKLSAARPRSRSPERETMPSHEDPIAIVGLSGLLPGSPSLEAFWSNLAAGRDLISEVPASRWDPTLGYQAGEAGEGKSNSKWGGFIDDVEGFDARFFGVPPWEADRMDPQHRLFLETAWNCLESAGEAPADLAGRRVGVFVGIQFHEYQDLLALAGDLHMYNATGNGHAMIANRLSYFLDLRGPSEAVDTACSSSLVALNRAVSAIRAGECESALVGGVSLILSPGTLVVTSQMGILSPDGRCKVFDAAANGYVKGEGILAAYLMPLSKAERGGYPVWGLVRGVGVNHGGRASSLTAPNSQAQSDLVSGVFRQAGVDPETVGYIEAHGTGTELGDPVEVEGLKSAFSVLTGRSTWSKPFCGLGSVKSNIGHLEPAAGLAGVAKVLLAMRHKTLPATLHLKTPNPYLKLEGSPFYLVAESRPWDAPRDGSGKPGPRRAGVSSFGFGGANAHVLLEEYQPVSTDRDEEPATSDSVFVISAKSEAAVRRRLADLSTWLASSGVKVSRQDLARTLQTGRNHFEHRCAVVASNLAELGEVLQVVLRGGSDRRVCFGKAGASGARLTQCGLATVAELAEAFVRGDAIAWSETGAGRLFRRLALPGYPFEKTQHWFRRAGGASVPAGVQTAASSVTAPAPMKLKALSGSRGGTTPGAPSTSQEPEPLTLSLSPGEREQPAKLPKSLDVVSAIAVRGDGLPGRQDKAPDGDQFSLAHPMGEGRGEGPSQFKDCEQVREDHAASRELSGKGSPLSSAGSGGEGARRAGEEVPQVPSRVKTSAEGAGESDRGVKVQAGMPSRSDVARAVSSIVATALYLDESTLDQTKSFVDLGCDSILGVEIIRRINTAFGINLPASKLYEHPNVAALSTYVAGLGAGSAATTTAIAPVKPLAPPSLAADPSGSRVVVNRSGDIDDLIYTTVDPPVPGEREIQVEVMAASVILPDLLCVRGLYPTMPPYPFTPGFEFAGVVREVGPKASLHKLGDRVFGVTGDTLGAHALRLNVREELAAKIPPDLSLIEAATVPEAFLTAYFSLIELGRLAEGERLLIGSAASGTGLAAIQLAQWRKAEVLAMVGSDEKVEYLRGLGISDVVNYREGDLAGFCAQFIGSRGVDVVLNMLTGEPREAAIRCLAPFGRFLDLAVAGLRADGRTDLSSMVSNQIYFSVDCRRLSGGGAEKIQRILGLLADLLAAGTIQPLKVNRLFDFSEAKRAYALVRDRVGIGKTLLYRRDSVMAASDESPRDVAVRRLPSVTRAGSFPEVAVIGMACRFPGAEDLEQFWGLLRQGRCAVREVPASRWASEQYFDPDAGAPGKTYSKWGGFLEGIDQFDPLFFSLSPAEAEQMDPQQRLFLETAWHAMEDAGYAAEGASGVKCGVFVGVGQGDYVEAVRKAGGELSASLLMGSSCSMIGARLAYFMNLTGPAVALDTACSSSLLAIYNACQSLAAGDSNLALAGGVCVMTTPAMYVMMSKARMLSPTGLCRTFDQGADGFVPGEGVGVIVLKLLNRALRDGDHIYGVIKGGGSNQDGATNGITAPNPASQKALEIETYRRAGVDPDSIGYVEAHGTGTKLGDPVEMDAITEAFRGFTQRRGFCAVGSVKTNIGHTLSAAGVASAIKTLLCLHHQKLVPSLHYRQPNEHIAFGASPFYVNTELRDWSRPDHAPRRAAVSSFGFSGTNVHLVFEEAPERVVRGGPSKPAYLLTLSARTDDGLRERIEQLSAWLAAGGRDVSLEDVAYTLNAGRMHFRKRCFVVADSVASLGVGLRQVRLDEVTRLVGPSLAEGDRRSGELIGDLAASLSHPARYTAILHELGGFYLQGVSLDWARLHDGEANQRISLPGYPFRRKRYWASGPTIESKTSSSPAAARHPLLDANGSGSAGVPFTRRVRPSDWFVRDHQVRGVKTVPGVAYLEMARAAAAARFGRGVSAIRKLVIRQPVHVQSDDVDVEVRLTPTEGGADFEIHTLGQGSSICHAQGALEFGEPRVVPERVSIHELEQAVHAPADKPAIYEYFQVAGLEYGAAFQALSRLGLDASGEIGIARLDLPSAMHADAAAYYLHPALLDGAWQSIAGWSLAGRENTPFALPFEVQEILLFGPLTEAGYVRARRGEASDSGEIHRYNVQFFDPAGVERCRVTGLTMKSVGPGRNPGGIQLFRPVWVPREVSPKPGRTPGSLLPRTRMRRDPEPGSLLSRPAGTLSSAGSGGEGRGEEAPFSAGVPGRLLVLEDNESRFVAIRAQCPEAVQVRRGDGFDCPSPGVLVVRPESTDDFAQLLSATHPEERVEAAVLCMWDLDQAAGANDRESEILLSNIALTRALIERGFSKLRMVQACRSRQAGLISGWAKSLRQEHAGFRCVAAEIDGDGGADLPARLLSEFAGELDDPEIRLTPADRLVVTYERDSASPTLPDAFRKHGVYLITGGLGGLGRLVAEHLARSVGARVALLGRSALTAEAQRWVDSLAALGGEGAYWNADVGQLDEVSRVVDAVKEKFGALHGVFHAAGVLRDSRLVNKTADEVRAVLSSKIHGALNLDLATHDLDLDFLVFFSSVAGALGSAGQADYAAANGFLDRFAEEREARRAAGHLRARTISINWPWWMEGGMRPAQATIDWLRTTWGLAGLETEAGLRLLEEILRSDMTRVLVLCGDEHRWTEITKRKEALVAARPAKEAAAAGSAWLRQQIIRLMAEQLKVDAAEIDQHEGLSAYGFDSISLTEFSNRLNRVHQLETTPALFFEYSTVASLADHLAGAYPDRFGVAAGSLPASALLPGTLQRTAEAPHASGPAVDEEQNRWIAVIAMDGRFPGAANLDEFWSNLESRRDCVSEVPAARWDWRKLAPELQHARWGGFIEGIDLFDAGLFGISRREAELMDPQQRLFLETVWTLLEQAGYPSNSAVPLPVGLFVGVSTCDYAELLGNDVLTAAHSPTGLSHSILVNRASFLLNLSGPSEAVNTACSSSLVALHRATRSLREGECDLAVAAGVNAILTPTTTLGFLQAGMLSRDGRCKTFDAHADGYVRGEGVGAVLLKRFKDAVRDGDAILGVILGSAVNHGGRTNTLTAPNPTAQSEVVLAACRDAGIAPSSISYIEAHGTGTVLGDPIEFNGLVKAFTAASASVQPGTCGLGSVKSNIGHLEAAAGIAGVIKVLLALQRRKLPATLHVREVNPYLRLEGSPFRLITETEDWVAGTEASHAISPRRAGVSSFGFGGANAHVVIGEIPSIPPVESGDAQPKPWSLATLSARDEQALLVKARELVEWLRREGARYALADICFTLNAGRHHLLRRRAFVVRTREELVSALEQVLAGQEPPEAIAGERIRMKPEDEALFRVVWESVSNSLVEAASAPDAYREKLWSLAGLYLKGYPLDWKLVHAGETRRRVPLPTYPFQRESYWVPGPGEAQRVTRSTKVSLPMAEQGGGNGSAGADGLVSVLASEAAALLKVAPEEIRADVNLSEYGFDSINFRSLAKALNDRLGLDLSPDVFFAHPTLTELAAHLAGRLPHPAAGSSPEASPEMLGATGTGAAETPVSAPRVHREPIPVAVVGMGGVFPGSPSVEAFWENLIGGRDLVGEVPASRWDWRATYGDPRRSADKTNSKWGGFIEDADCFDAEFFGISPREAEMMDPQQRLFLQCAWTAIESAGVAPEQLSGTPVGVFLGIQFNDYQELLARAGVSDPYGGTGNAHSIAANRISYLFNLTGPSETIDTACSSSLVAVHRAVQSLRLGECDAALAGGVNLMLSPSAFVATSQLGALSPDGRCRVFDARANGYVRGEGAGAIFLMRLSDAESGGYPILGIIQGSAVNHGGRAQSLTAPNARAQAALLQKAYADAGVDLGTVGYVEAHGTGTELGDPVEVEGLKMAFAAMSSGRRNQNPASHTCGLGSVKSNIGHLEAAAGIAGVIKVLLALRHGTLPASLHFQKLNPFIRIEETPFYVVDQPTPWECPVGVSGEAMPRRAGVSSFGFGGANAHVVIEEGSHNQPEERSREGLDQLFLLSARTEEALRRRIEEFRQWLHGQGAGHSLAAISRTLSAGRSHYACRAAFVARSQQGLIQALDEWLGREDEGADSVGNRKPRRLASGKETSRRAQEVLTQLRRPVETLNGSHREHLVELAALYCQGENWHWSALGEFDSDRPRIALPTYPFARTRYWIPTQLPANLSAADRGPEPPVAVSLTDARCLQVLAEFEADRMSLEEAVKELQTP